MAKILYPTPITAAAVDPSWFRDTTITGITFTEPCLWLFTFSNGVSIQVESLWRLLDQSHIVLTSDDHAQKFGLPAPLDAVAEALRLIGTQTVAECTLRVNTLDLVLCFSRGHRLEILPTSSGYEAWQITVRGQHIVAVGGGKLASYTQET